jgi:GNAT superfamily N-acetyltransferase
MPPATKSRIKLRPVTGKDWPLVEKLFGDKGACGGCWCMYWRIPRGGKMWEGVKGEPNRRQSRKLITAGKALGILALDDSEPVGWCSFGPREEFPRLDRTRAYQHTVPPGTWSIVCFYLNRSYRGRGLSRALAAMAVEQIRKHGGKFVEAFPVTLTKEGKKLPAAFSYTGPETVFQSLGFVEIQRLSQSRPLYRLELVVRG